LQTCTIATIRAVDYTNISMNKEFLGEYKVIRKVGEGGMAEVFLAHHKDVPDHRVILKKLKDPSLGKSFRKEANNLAKLNEHQNICTIFHFFTDDDKTIIVMQYIEGATLKDIIESEKKLPISVVLKLAVDLLRIISYAHERKIYHRDIKPGNIMVDKQGDLKVIDFGIAKDEADPEQTAAGIFSGTPLFAPLEQFNPMAKIDWPKADIYAIGTTLYLMVTGKLPFRGRNWSEIAESKRHAELRPPSSLAPEIPKEFDRIILKSISRLPEDRYANAGEMLSDVEALRIKNIVEPVNLEDTINIEKLTPVFDDATINTRKPSPPESESKPEPTSKRKLIIPTVLSVLSTVIIVSALYLHFSLDIFGLSKGDTSLAETNEQIQRDNPVTAQNEAAAEVVEFGYINIIVSPAADVYVGDSLVANDVSRKLIKLPPGELSLRLVNDKAIDNIYFTNISVVTGDTIDLAHKFEFAPRVQEGRIKLTISPSGDFYLDDKLVAANVSKYELKSTAGSHTLRIENNDKSVDSVIFDSFELSADQTINLSYTFMEKPLLGELIVGTWPVGGSVYINGELQPNTAPFTFSLKPGKYIVRLLLESPPIDRETTLVIVAGDTLRFVARSAD